MSEYDDSLLHLRYLFTFSLREKEELHEDAIVRFHELMNPNRRASRYYVTREGVRMKYFHPVINTVVNYILRLLILTISNLSMYNSRFVLQTSTG